MESVLQYGPHPFWCISEGHVWISHYCLLKRRHLQIISLDMLQFTLLFIIIIYWARGVLCRYKRRQDLCPRSLQSSSLKPNNSCKDYLSLALLEGLTHLIDPLWRQQFSLPGEHKETGEFTPLVVGRSLGFYSCPFVSTIPAYGPRYSTVSIYPQCLYSQNQLSEPSNLAWGPILQTLPRAATLSSPQIF